MTNNIFGRLCENYLLMIYVIWNKMMIERTYCIKKMHILRESLKIHLYTTEGSCYLQSVIKYTICIFVLLTKK